MYQIHNPVIITTLKINLNDILKIYKYLIESHLSWQLYRHPDPRFANELVPIHEVIKEQAERDEDSELEAVGKLLSNIMNAKNSFILGDVDESLYRKCDQNGNIRWYGDCTL